MEKFHFKNIDRELIRKTFTESFLLYFFASFLPGIIYYTYYYQSSSFIIWMLAIIVLVGVYKAIVDYRAFSEEKKILYISSSINIAFWLIISILILNIYTWSINYSTNDLPFIFLYWITFISLVIYRFRKHEMLVVHKVHSFIKYCFKSIKSVLNKSKEKTLTLIRRILILPVLLDYLSVRKLNKNPQALFFAKKFVVIQTYSMKNILPGTHPSQLHKTVKNLFKSDLDRMYQLYQLNHIKFHSKRAILTFVMRVAEPIITDLQLTLEQHLTEELLKVSNNSKDLQINMDDLWKKSEKVITNWQSTFSENELEYKDSLLQR